MSVKINHSGVIEEKIRAIDDAEHDELNELEEFTDEKQVVGDGSSKNNGVMFEAGISLQAAF